MSFGDAKSVLDRLQAVERAVRAKRPGEASRLALEAQDALTWGVAKGLIGVTEFERAKAHLRRLVGGR